MQKVLMNTDGIDYIFGAYDGEAADFSVADHTFSRPTRVLWIGVGGDLDVTLESNTRLTFKNVPSGGWWEGRVRIVHTGTTASEIIGVV